MLAQGARCLIGDHLHPTGAIDQTTYRAVGAAYAHIKAREPWAEGSANVAEIGLLSAEAAARPRLAGAPGHFQDEDDGAVRILLESKFTFDVLDPESDFSNYRLLILPDLIKVGPELKAKIEAYVAGGGRVLMTGRSGIDEAAGRFAFDIGADWHGASPLTGGGDYLLPMPELRASFVDDPLYIYDPARAHQGDHGHVARRDLRALFRPGAEPLQRPHQHTEQAGSVRI